MGIQEFLIEQTALHPAMRPQDMIKLCYQATFGPEHALSALTLARQRFDAEFASVSGDSLTLYERISPNYCRVNLSGWKARGLSPQWLFNMFAGGMDMSPGTDLDFANWIETADDLCHRGALPFSYTQWQAALLKYRQLGGGAVHHSTEYRLAERPAYRLVSAQVIRLFPFLERLATLPKGDCRVIALDGRAASGKTTLAHQLSVVLGAGVIHMDDFFLPVALRTPERLSEPGGNIHYERFKCEVLPNIGRTTAFEYRRFDCQAMDYAKETRAVCAASWRIAEGAYSCHPLFGNYMALRVFCTVDSAEQIRRINQRDGTQSAKVFAARWIPMEERYFTAYRIPENADIIL